MTALTPQEAARMARGVYLLRERTVSAVQSSNSELGCEGLFKVDDSSRFVGRSLAGRDCVKTLSKRRPTSVSGVGLVERGKAQGRWQFAIADPRVVCELVLRSMV